MRACIPRAHRDSHSRCLPAGPGVRATHKVRLSRSALARPGVRSEGRGRRNRATPQAHHGDARIAADARALPEPGRAGRQCRPRRASPGRTPPPAGRGLLLPGAKGSGGKAPGAVARTTSRRLGPRAPSSACASRAPNPAAAHPPPPPAGRRGPCRCPRRCSGRRPASGCSWWGGTR